MHIGDSKLTSVGPVMIRKIEGGLLETGGKVRWDIDLSMRKTEVERASK